MGLIGRIKYGCGRIVERHPYSQNLVKQLLLRLPVLLPHDRSYLGMQHLLGHSNKLFLDVGANDGISALSFRRIDRARGFTILSIEPNRLHEKSLMRIKSCDKRFDYRLIAAGDKPDTLMLYTPVYGRVALHTAASLSLEQARSTMKNYMPAYVSRRVRYEEQTVEVIVLDDLDLSPGIIKIDAEGFDDRVLTGLSKTIARHRPHVLTERHPETAAGLDQFCVATGYSMLRYDDVADQFIPFDGVETRNVYLIPSECTATLPLVTHKRKVA